MNYATRLIKEACFVIAGLPLIISAADFKVTDYGAKPDGETINTAFIQKAIDAAANAGGGKVVFEPGVYMSGALFVKSKVNLHLDEGVVIRAVPIDTFFPERPTRVAGIEMVWPTALVNVYQESDVIISGKGVIDGNGKHWWRKFWGDDGNGGMMIDYRSRGLRWAVDYDCKRVRALAVYDSKDVEIRDVTVNRSGFWSVTLTYSERVRIDGVTIRANIGGFGPSSDGIDIDSSRDILVENCDIDCNDDNICLKAGRDSDGLRVNRPTENITIRNCVTRSGHGMLTLGSETSGGIRNVLVENIKAYGTSNGIRIKSAKVRGGVIENIKIRNIEMHAVEYPLHFELNWYPAYSYPVVPEGIDLETMPKHWKVMTTRVDPPERGIPEVRGLEISGIKATGAAKAIYANGYHEKPLRDVAFKDVVIEAKEAGSLSNAKNWTFENVEFRVIDPKPIKTDGCENLGEVEISSLNPEVWQEAQKALPQDDGQAIRLGHGEEDKPKKE